MTAKATFLDPVTAGEHILGPEDADVTIIEYGDFECPHCKKAAPTVGLLLKRFAGRARLVFRHFPQEEVHLHALSAAEAAEAAGEQGRFWEMHDLLFARQPHLQPPHLRELAQQLDLDMRPFAEALRSHVYVPRIRQDAESGRRAGVRATPTFYVNEKICDVSFGLEMLERTVAQAFA